MRFLGPFDIRFELTKETFEALASLRDASEGNFSRLAERLRKGVQLWGEERLLAASALSGQVRRSAHRPRKAETTETRHEVALFVLMREAIHGEKREAAVECAGAHFGFKRRYVFKALKELSLDPKREQAARGLADTVARMHRAPPTIPLPVLKVKLEDF